MVHARVFEAYNHFLLVYTEDHIFPLLPIKYLINEDGERTTQFNFATGTKTSISYLRVLCCPCFVRKATTHVGKKAVKMRHQSQTGFQGIFVGITQDSKGYIVYVPHTRKIVS